MQSAPELRVEAVDYVQQDLTGQAVNQTAETLAILVDTTAGAAELQAAKTIIMQVPHSIIHCSKRVTMVPSRETYAQTGQQPGRARSVSLVHLQALFDVKPA